MSFTDSAVQPDPGQGGDPTGAGGGAPYQQYLDEVPEEHRGTVEPAFKRWDGDMTRRFQEHAQYRDQWAPFEQAGLNQYDPAELAQLVAFAQMTAQRPDDYRQWLQQQAQEHGLLDDPAGGDLDDDPTIAALISRELGPVRQALDGLTEWREQQDLQSLQSSAQSEIEQQLAALRDRHGDFDSSIVESFLANHIGTGVPLAQVVDKAYADYQRFVAQIEQGFVDRKGRQPPAAVVPGSADTNPPAIQTMRDAAAAAFEQLKQQNTA